jgi:carbon storage regulator
MNTNNESHGTVRAPLAAAMLVLARKENQNIIIDGKIIVRVLRVGRDVVKLGIEAPLSIPVHREEVFKALQEAELKGAPADGNS